MSPVDDFDVGERLEAFAGGGDHARAGIDADDRARARCQQFGEHAIAGSDVEHVAGSTSWVMARASVSQVRPGE